MALLTSCWFDSTGCCFIHLLQTMLSEANGAQQGRNLEDFSDHWVGLSQQSNVMSSSMWEKNSQHLLGQDFFRASFVGNSGTTVSTSGSGSRGIPLDSAWPWTLAFLFVCGGVTESGRKTALSKDELPSAQPWAVSHSPIFLCISTLCNLEKTTFLVFVYLVPNRGAEEMHTV